MHEPERFGLSTRCVHEGRHVDPLTRAVATPIYENSAYASLDAWRAVATGRRAGYIYSRNSNPTTDAFERKIAALEGAEAATSFSTGMAAISSTLMALLIAEGLVRYSVGIEDAADLIADLAAALAPLDPGQRPAPPS